MDQLGDLLTTRPIQTGCEFTIKPYLSGRIWFIDNTDHQIGNGSVWARTRTRSYGPEPLLTLPVIQLAIGAFMSSLSVKGCNKSWEADERDQQFGVYDSIHIGRRQSLRTEGNARFNNVLAMRPGLAKIIEKVRNSWYFEIPELIFI